MRKKLTCSSKDSWIGGVFGGLGECYNVDQNVLRIIWILLLVFSSWSGAIFLLYIIAWALIPNE